MPDLTAYLPPPLRKRLRRDHPLAPYTTWRVGGPARWFLEVATEAELRDAVAAAEAAQVPWRILGDGSNLWVADAGVEGLVVRNRVQGWRWLRREGEEGEVAAASGQGLARLGRELAAAGWAGLEWAATVPGTVGGAVVGNAGAFGGDVASVLIWARVWIGGREEVWPVRRLEYGYRHSALKGRPEVLVLEAAFRVRRADPALLLERIRTWSERRRATQPPGATAGSVFRNPPGDHAGRLIEAAGLKGLRIGGARVSEVHANFIVTEPGARAADVRALIERIQAEVEARFGVRLEPEVVFWEG